MELTFVEEQVIKFYRQLSSLGKAKALVYLESTINEEKREKEIKENLAKKNSCKYCNRNTCKDCDVKEDNKEVRDCKHLDWEMEGSICKIGAGTQYGRCKYPFDNKVCFYYKKKD